MNTDTPAIRYESLSIALHWLMLLRLAAVGGLVIGLHATAANAPTFASALT